MDLARQIRLHLDNRLFYSVKHVDVMLTRECNLRCDYCFVYGKRQGVISLSIIDRLFDVLRHLTHGSRRCSITLIGGEPLLYPGLIRHFIGEGERRGYALDYSITTNGILVSPEILRYLSAHRIKLLLSIDGGRETHDRHRKDVNGVGTFDKIAAKIPLLKRYQGWLGARVTPTPETVGRLSADLRELHALGINQFIVGCASGVKWRKSAINSYLEQIKTILIWYDALKDKGDPIKLSLAEHEDKEPSNYFGCGAGRSRIAIDVDGSIYGCAKLATAASDGGGVGKIGHLFDPFPVSDPDTRAALFDYETWRNRRCEECGQLGRCHGGCPAANFTSTGSMYIQADWDCKMTRQISNIQQERAEKNAPELSIA